MNLLRLALSGFRRELLSAEVLTLIIALALGTAAMLSVRLLSERIAAGLARDAATWIGGDFGIAGRTAIDPRWVEEARARGLRATRIVQFPTVLFHGEASQMVELKAVEESYPSMGSCWSPPPRPPRAAPTRRPNEGPPSPSSACLMPSVSKWETVSSYRACCFRSQASCAPSPTSPAISSSSRLASSYASRTSQALGSWARAAALPGA